MFLFLWILGAMGVAYWARLGGRNPVPWFVVAIALTPLGGSILLMMADRWWLPRR